MRKVLLGILSISIILIIILSTAGYGTSEIKEKIQNLLIYIESLGPLGPFIMFICHSIAVIVCFPGTILFEIGSGVLFGFVGGTLLVSLSKSVGALIGFLLGRTLLYNYVKNKFSNNKKYQHIYDNIGKESWKFAILLRLSPLPSWLNTYGLSITSIKIIPFFLSTLFGSLPMICQNVYFGTFIGDIGNIAVNSNHTHSNAEIFRIISILATGIVTILITRFIIKQITLTSSTLIEEKKEIEIEKKGSNQISTPTITSKIGNS